MNATDLIDCIEDAGYNARSYSGRGMYGKQCVSFNTDDGEIYAIVEIIQNCGDDQRDDLLDALKSANADGMGRGSVIYFPRIAWPEGRADGDEDDGDEARV